MHNWLSFTLLFGFVSTFQGLFSFLQEGKTLKIYHLLQGTVLHQCQQCKHNFHCLKHDSNMTEAVPSVENTVNSCLPQCRNTSDGLKSASWERKLGKIRDHTFQLPWLLPTAASLLAASKMSCQNSKRKTYISKALWHAKLKVNFIELRSRSMSRMFSSTQPTLGVSPAPVCPGTGT